MSYPKVDSADLFNLNIAACVRAEKRTGQNTRGAFARIGEALGLSPATIRAHYEGKHKATQRSDLLARCHAYLDDLMDRRHEEIKRLAAEINALRQLALPLEAKKDVQADPETKGRISKHLLAADRALAQVARGSADPGNARTKRVKRDGAEE